MDNSGSAITRRIMLKTLGAVSVLAGFGLSSIAQASSLAEPEDEGIKQSDELAQGHAPATRYVFASDPRAHLPGFRAMPG
ncbi:MAG: hypothetical protein WBC71_05595 [Salaquimonas sp.]